MSTHTPGPWKDGSLHFSSGWRCVVNLPGGRSIDVADPRNRPTDDEDKANAALIAAAPDTLAERDTLKARVAVLERALEEISKMPDSDYQDDRTHQCVARSVLGKPKCQDKGYCEVCWPEED